LLVQPLRPSRDVITVFPSLFVNKCVWCTKCVCEINVFRSDSDLLNN
jgi:hypothetical protein